MKRLALVLLLAACKRAPQGVPAEPRIATRPTETHVEPAFKPKALQRCFADDASGAAARPLNALLDRASDLHDEGSYESALACAEEATRVEPRSVEGHEDRALALVELGRKDESRAAIARALAIDPDDPHTLLVASDLLLNRFGAKDAVGADDAAAALEHALRGIDRVRRSRAKADRSLRARLELLAGQALADLGRAKDALPHLDASIAAAPDDVTARYERGAALFELCRFQDAERALRDVVGRDAKDALAHQELGLTLEQLGDSAGAAREMADARRLDPTGMRAPIAVDRVEFEKLVHAEIAALPENLRTDLAKVQLELPDLPDVADLTADDPPLPPTILGLFRGSPLDEVTFSRRPSEPEDPEPRAIALYRLNLIRAVQSKDELRQQIRTTLHHELGHLRGEDDDALRARGLE